VSENFTAAVDPRFVDGFIGGLRVPSGVEAPVGFGGKVLQKLTMNISSEAFH